MAILVVESRVWRYKINKEESSLKVFSMFGFTFTHKTEGDLSFSCLVDSLQRLYIVNPLDKKLENVNTVHKLGSSLDFRKKVKCC